jgi:hypothetical protein
MCRKLVSLVVVYAVALLLCPIVTAGSKEEKDLKLTEKVRVAVTKLGTGPAARIQVKLQDDTQLIGYLSEVRDDSFVIVDDKTGSAHAMLYPQVKHVKGNNLSTGAKIAIGVGIAIGIIAIFIGIANGNG